MSTFVTVGNATQPFDRLIDAVQQCQDVLPAPIFIQYGVSSSTFACQNGVPFLTTEEFERRVAGATVLVLHAGAGSVIHALRAGKTPIVMPRRAEFSEIIDDHQLEFCRVLLQAERIRAANSVEELRDAVIKLNLGGLDAHAKSPSVQMLTLVRQAIERGLGKCVRI